MREEKTEGGGQKAAIGKMNIQHPTSNIERPMLNDRITEDVDFKDERRTVKHEY